MELRNWLEKVLPRLNPTDDAYREFSALRDRFSLVTERDNAKNQVAQFYVRWFEKIASVSAAGRALALYQDLSSAFVLGKQLPPLPKSEAPGQTPSKVAEQLMLNCL
jgi:hypothetical protein